MAFPRQKFARTYFDNNDSSNYNFIKGGVHDVNNQILQKLCHIFQIPSNIYLFIYLPYLFRNKLGQI